MCPGRLGRRPAAWRRPASTPRRTAARSPGSRARRSSSTGSSAPASAGGRRRRCRRHQPHRHEVADRHQALAPDRARGRCGERLGHDHLVGVGPGSVSAYHPMGSFERRSGQLVRDFHRTDGRDQPQPGPIGTDRQSACPRSPPSSRPPTRVRTGTQSAEELVRACLDAVEEHNDRLNAFVHLDAELALAEARAVDAAVRDGDAELGPLAGVPFGVKDLEDCAGMPTTKGSRWFADGPPKTADSLHVGRLRAAGAIPIGKTAAPEFGAWAYTASPLLGVTRNPWDPSVTPGGSSGGSTRGGVGRDGAVRHRQRRRRVDPHPGRLHRARGPAPELRPHPHLRRHAPGPERRRRVASPPPSPTPPCCST